VIVAGLEWVGAVLGWTVVVEDEHGHQEEESP